MKRFSLILIVVCICLNSFSQEGVADNSTIKPKRYATMQFLGHSITSFHFEHSLLGKKDFSLLGEIGIGLAEFPDGEQNPAIPAVYAFDLWFPLQYSFSGIELIACVSPSFYKYGKLGFIDLNGMFGVRTNFSRKKFKKGIVLGIYYSPKIYQTISNPNDIYFHTPISLKIGASF